MAIESRGLAQYQNASELSGSCTNMTLHSDHRTAKHGRSYTAFDVINEQGKLLVCGSIRLLNPSSSNVPSSSQTPRSRDFL